MKKLAVSCLFLLGLTSACADEECAASYKDLFSDPIRVCTSQTSTATVELSSAVPEIGVTILGHEGEDHATCFEKAQICPNRSPLNYQSWLVGTDRPFNLLLTNAGQTPLHISSIKVRGDDRCAFAPPQFAPAITTPIPPKDGLIIRLKYNPPSTGQDHIFIEINSDAENFPLLGLAACGKAVNSTTTPGALTFGLCEDRSTAEFTTCWDD